MNEILEHRRKVQENILKSFGVENSVDNIEKSQEDELEKAHKDGDMHPNGKWVWVSSANNGKGDWRTAGGRAHKKHSESKGSGDSKEKNENNLDSYASKTSTEDLKKVVSSEKADNKLKEAAKKELEKRGDESKVEDKKEESSSKSKSAEKEDKLPSVKGLFKKDSNIVNNGWGNVSKKFLRDKIQAKLEKAGYNFSKYKSEGGRGEALHVYEKYTHPEYGNAYLFANSGMEDEKGKFSWGNVNIYRGEKYDKIFENLDKKK